MLPQLGLGSQLLHSFQFLLGEGSVGGFCASRKYFSVWHACATPIGVIFVPVGAQGRKI
jgi:hypothetical protein